MDAPSLLDISKDILLLIVQEISPSAFVCVKFTCTTFHTMKRPLIQDDIIKDSLSNKTPDVFIFLRDDVKIKVKVGVCTKIVKHGNLEFLKWARENKYVWDVFTCSEAAWNGHLECLKYLHENGCPWDEDICSNAACNGHLECLKYAHENRCPWDENTCSTAAWKGNLKCLKYAHKHGCPWNKYTCKHAAQRGYLECLKYAHENGCPWDEDECIAKAKEYNHIHVLEWIAEQN